VDDQTSKVVGMYNRYPFPTTAHYDSYFRNVCNSGVELFSKTGFRSNGLDVG